MTIEPTLSNSSLDDRKVASEVEAASEAAASSTISSKKADLQEPVGLGQELRIFASTFLTILIAELGDKTQITTLLMAAESQSPWVVFLGAGTALIVTSLLGVLVGRWISKRVSPRTLDVVVAGILLTVSVLLFWDVSQG